MQILWSILFPWWGWRWGLSGSAKEDAGFFPLYLSQPGLEFNGMVAQDLQSLQSFTVVFGEDQTVPGIKPGSVQARPAL